MKTPTSRRKKEPDEVLEDDTDECTFEFTDLGPHLTGLPFFVWVRPSMGLRRDVWVGVSPDRQGSGGCDLIQVAMRPDVRVVKGKMSNRNLALLRQWVDLNRDMIVNSGIPRRSRIPWPSTTPCNRCRSRARLSSSPPKAAMFDPRNS